MKILLAEDDQVLANFLRRGLKYEKFSVESVADGKEALDRILKKKYDIVILDLILPSMDGREVVRHARKANRDTPIIVLTAVNDSESRIGMLNAGVDDYLSKPFSFVELVARIRSVIRRSQARSKEDERLVISDLVLIPSQNLAMRGAKKIQLRLKEYALLEYLMRNANRVVSRHELFEKVWDYNTRITSNTVDSHLSLLRKKINQNHQKDLIETVHGVGYILREE